jgi:hypothetical protein
VEQEKLGNENKNKPTRDAVAANLTREKLKGEIEHKKICIFLTEKVIANPPTDIVSIIMAEQAVRLKEELSKLEEQLASLPSEKKKVRKNKKKQVVKKATKRKGRRRK